RLAVGLPADEAGAVGGHLIAASGDRKALDVALLPAGFVGVVGEPLAVERHRRLRFIRARAQVRMWLAVTLEPRHADVPLSLRIEALDDQRLAVGRPAIEAAEIVPRGQHDLGWPAAVRRYDRDQLWAEVAARIGHALTIRRPPGVFGIVRFGRDAGDRAALEFDDEQLRVDRRGNVIDERRTAVGRQL